MVYLVHRCNKHSNKSEKKTFISAFFLTITNVLYNRLTLLHLWFGELSMGEYCFAARYAVVLWVYCDV